ncbi:MAG TPA: glycosyltransferase family 4 protein [Candidatus Nanoarchaeia archaeon]|nr:glycosyltransferase family 4 protein [Candidatus Nanoarchaeia archaeon]
MSLAKIIQLKDAIINFFDRTDRLVYVAETNDWIVKWVGQHVVGELNRRGLMKSRVSLSSFGLKNKIIHYGSINSFLRNGLENNKNGNKIVVSWYHVVPDDERLRHIEAINDRVDLVLTACQTTKKELIMNGLKEDKIAVVALGVDLNDFKALPSGRRAELRKRLGLPDDKIIIGSFQKDGNGWGEGLEPKLIKGPDVFCAAVIELAKKYPIEVLLTGPARGYVKRRLQAAGVPYLHRIADKQKDLADYYNCLDLYLIASRVEGGPESLSESWATGVPVVSTRMGMPADFIIDGRNGMLAEVEDVDGLAKAADKLLSDKILREKIINQALVDVKKLGWDNLSTEYYDKIYHKLS